MARYLTKSRFKLAVECPTKLFYTGKKEYSNLKNENDFLKALADGGFQVGELAKLMYPGGIEIEFSGDFEKAINQTNKLLKQENIILYEAAIKHENYFVLVDILVKKGHIIELIEVKAKSFNSEDTEAFRNTTGGINKDILPYLQDIAFQTYVAKKAFTDFEFKSYLMLSDKSKKCSVFNLNQNFKIAKDNNNRTTVQVNPEIKKEDLGDPILTTINVDEFVSEILEHPLQTTIGERRFEDAIQEWSESYLNDFKIFPSITKGTHCKNCEFKKSNSYPDLKSGFLECWQEVTNKSKEELESGTIVDIFSLMDKETLIRQGKYLFSDLNKDDLKYKESKNGITLSQRQWMQVSGAIPGKGDYFFNSELATEEMSKWIYPLHFIDFETSRTAIPFFKGQRPYSNVAFQFSHHIVSEDQTVKHQTQYLETRCGVHPNYAFVRALMKAVGEKGTIFMWTPHENTTLKNIYDEILEDDHPPSDSELLKQFIQDITSDKKNGNVNRSGQRAMYDLCDLSKRAFFHKLTGGSSSIKKVLPAVMKSSKYLEEKYSKPLTKQNGDSLNFDSMIWWRKDGNVINPYKLLPPVFTDISTESLEILELDPDLHISEGGAATVAYGRLQFSSIPSEERKSVENSLLRYCELDTLAMVMVYEAFREYKVHQDAN